MAARHDVENALFIRHLSHGERKRGVHVAKQKVDTRALDQLTRLEHRNPGVAAGRIFDDEIDRTAEDAAPGVDLVERHLAASELVLAKSGVGAGQRIVEPDFDGLRGPRREDERPSNPGARERQPGLDNPATAYRSRIGVGHFFLPDSNRPPSRFVGPHASTDT
jgi:hypothetical protein